MPRTELDLRGLSMTDLMEMDREVGHRINNDFRQPVSIEETANDLADRRQIRQAMEALRESNLTHV